MSEIGPVYGIELIPSLPLGGGSMRQALPNRRDLIRTREYNDSVAAGVEVLTEHYRRAMAEIERLQAALLAAERKMHTYRSFAERAVESGLIGGGE